MNVVFPSEDIKENLKEKFHANIEKPTPIPVNLGGIPDDLKDRKIWVLWNYEWRIDKKGIGKWTKVPLQPRGASKKYSLKHNGRLWYAARSNDPETWSTFDEVVNMFGPNRRSIGGLGVMLREGLLGGDIDNGLDGNGSIKPWAAEILKTFDTSTDLSPSGTGIKVLACASFEGLLAMPEFSGLERTADLRKRKKYEDGEIEFYDKSSPRFFTITGNRFGDFPASVNERQAEFASVYLKVFGIEVQEARKTQAVRAKLKTVWVATKNPKRVHVEDEVVLKLARRARNGEKFQALWGGSTDHHEGDHSAADLALCQMLAFWTGPDLVRIERMFGASKLGVRDKWTEREDYRTRTIQTAIDRAVSKDEFYDWSKYEADVSLHESEADVMNLLGGMTEGAGTDGASEGYVSLPEIVINGRQLRDVTSDALAAIHLANTPPRYFTRGSAPVRIDREDGTVKFNPLSQDMMRGVIARAADWYQVSYKNDKEIRTPKHPPDNVVKDLLSLPPSGWKFPYVDTIVRYPVFTKAGLLRPGYEPGSRIWYEPNGKIEVQDKPAQEDVAEAAAFINDNVFHDFPFVSESDRANCWAAMLGWYVRHLIDGPTPLHIVDAPVEGTGKGKLMNAIIYTATGRWPSTFKEAHGDDEWRKLLTTALLEAPDYIFIDNINYALNSGAFAGILTDREHSDRILGGNRRVSLAVKNLWFATGNNVRGSKEIVRRSVRIRLDAKCETPSNRTGWKHNLDTWVPQHRDQILRACLTVCQSWFRAGMPRSDVTMGSYENWASIMGGILQHAGIPGFLDNRKRMMEEMNSADDEWSFLISQWYEAYDIKPVKPNMLMQIAVSEGILSKYYEGRTERGMETNWGMAISRQVDRVYGGKQVKFAGTNRKGTKEYKLTLLDGSN